MARTRRLLRRIGEYSYTLEPRTRVSEHLSMELASRVAVVDGRRVELTPIETKLLYLLVRSAGHTLQSVYLLRRLWPREEAFEESLRTHVWRLRKKLAEAPDRYIETIRGVGYRFRGLAELRGAAAGE
ncbi:MAG: response regulator transcription factor [bacterium]|nr:response regulator transcription factor [bacterium]